jgi:hypothetical protein
MGGGAQPQIPVTVTTAATPVPPLSGGTLLVTADGTTAVASDPDREQVYLVDLANKSVRATVLQAGDEPGRVVEDGAGRLHVALRRGGAVATIDPKTATVTARRSACAAPRGLAYQAAGDLVQVACAGGELVSLPAAGGAATRTVMLDRDLRDVVVGTNGSLLVSTFRKAEVLVVGADGTVSSRMRPGSGPVPTITGMPQMRTPSVAWRMVSRGGTDGSVVMLHQTGVTDAIRADARGRHPDRLQRPQHRLARRRRRRFARSVEGRGRGARKRRDARDADARRGLDGAGDPDDGALRRRRRQRPVPAAGSGHRRQLFVVGRAVRADA